MFHFRPFENFVLYLRADITQLLQYGRLLFPFGGFAGVLREGLRQRIGIAGFEEDHIFWSVLVLHLFDCVIHTVFPGDFLEIPDVRIVAFDGGYALILPNQLFHGLLAVGDDGTITLFVFSVFKVFADRRFENPSGQLCCRDG